MRYAILISLLFLFSIGYAQNKSKPITEISQNELNNVILIDVRTPEEYQAGHLKNSININWYDTDFAKQMEVIEKNKTIYVYCKKGGRSARAAQLLDSLGYHKVLNLAGGYDAWSARDN